MRVVIASFATAAAFCVTSTVRAQDAKDLQGRWEPTMVNRGGAGAIIEFRQDKKFLVMAGLLQRGTYTVDSVKITFSAPSGEQPLIRGYEVKGDTLTVWSSRHPTFSLVRTTTSQSRSGIVGEWAVTQNERTTYETLRADGTYRIWMPVQVDSSGEYFTRRNFVTIRQGRMESVMMWRLTEIGLDLQRAANTRGSMPSLSFIRERQ